MKKLITAAFAALAAFVYADPMSFPYDTTLTDRITTNQTVEVAGESVEITGTTTPATDTVATLAVDDVTFTAVDADEWDDFVSDLSGTAMLTIKNTDETYTWWGYTGSGWVQLDGGPDIDLSSKYDVAIYFDKTTGNKIRYAAAKGDGAMTAFTYGSAEWIPQGGSATQLTAIKLTGVGSIDAATLASGARTAYANVTNVEQSYSFDYSNVVFTVYTGEGSYGSGTQLKITLKNGDTTVATKTISAAANKTNDVEFTQLTPGRAYDCTIEVTSSDVPTGVITNAAEGVKLYASADWFGFADGEFVKVGETNNVVISGTSFAADDDELPVDVIPAEESGENTMSTVEIILDYTNYAVTGDLGDAQSALALTENGWKCAAGDVWTAITNDNVSTDNGVYTTRAEFDYTVNPGKVRFSVKSDDTWYVMKNDDVEWFNLSGTSNRLYSTSFVGGGKVNAIAANYHAIGTIQPTVDTEKKEITVTGSTDADLSKIDEGEYTVKSTSGKNFNMKWTDSDGRFAKVENGKLVVKGGTPANGLTSYNSFVLGLDAETATSKPVLDSAQNSSASSLTFKVPNVVPNTDAAEVTMKVITLDSPTATTGTETAFENGQATVELDPSGVKYYKVKISIKTK